MRIAQRIHALRVRPDREPAVLPAARRRTTDRSRRASGRAACTSPRARRSIAGASGAPTIDLVRWPAGRAGRRVDRPHAPAAPRFSLPVRRAARARASPRRPAHSRSAIDADEAAVAHDLLHAGHALDLARVERSAASRHRTAAARRARAPCPASAGPARRSRRPVTFAGMSTRGIDCADDPVRCPAVAASTSAAPRRAASRPSTSSPYATLRPSCARTTPSSTVEIGSRRRRIALRPSPTRQLARLRRRVADRRAAVLHRLAARGVALVRRARRVGGDQRDAGGVDDELLGGDLDERGLDALAELGLAREDRDASVCVDAHPRVEHRRA